jgi:hypothetical protein
VNDTFTTKRLFKHWTRVYIPSIDNTNAVYVCSKPINDEPECLMFTSEGHTMVLKGNINGVPTKV